VQTPPQSLPQSQEAAQLVQNDPAVQQAVQDNPASNEPIIITPRSVRAGNPKSAGKKHEYGTGYSGGNGNGPLIYNP